MKGMTLHLLCSIMDLLLSSGIVPFFAILNLLNL